MKALLTTCVLLLSSTLYAGECSEELSVLNTDLTAQGYEVLSQGGEPGVLMFVEWLNSSEGYAGSIMFFNPEAGIEITPNDGMDVIDSGTCNLSPDVVWNFVIIFGQPELAEGI